MKILILLLSAMSLSGADETGFQHLFDGKTLNGWKLVNGKGPGYIVEGDRIVCPKEGGGNLFTEKEFSNFTLRFEFMLSPGGNNGIGIRAPYAGDVAYSGMEIQVLDDSDQMYKGVIKPEQYHGSVYDVIPARTGYRKPAGEWNEEEITANGRRITVTLNGVIILDASLDMVKEPKVLEKHPGLARTGGHIGFLGHGSHVEFRNIRVKELK
ncbi:MAG TPA: DUF1080 domain-containing protein [Bryobacteraceae bacterium]|nr:DUF1080 domain-containing protein [Bryobacteraceae bacterium]